MLEEYQPHIINLYSNLSIVKFPLMKVIPAEYILEHAIVNGYLNKGSEVIESSSGTFALGLAIICAQKGLKLTIVGDKAIQPSLHKKISFLGAKILIAEEPFKEGGPQSKRLEILQDYISNNSKVFWTQQYDNPLNRKSYKSCAERVCKKIKNIDIFICPVGSGGSISGFAEHLIQINPNAKIIAVDTPHSILFGQQDGKRKLRGLGNSLYPKNLIYKYIDNVHWVNFNEAVNAARQLYYNYGLFCGLTSGAAFLVAAYEARINKNANVLVVFPDDGSRYEDELFNYKDNNKIIPVDNYSPCKIYNPSEKIETWSWYNWNKNPTNIVSGINL